MYGTGAKPWNHVSLLAPPPWLQTHARDLGVAQQQLAEAQDAVAQLRLTNGLLQQEADTRLAEVRGRRARGALRVWWNVHTRVLGLRFSGQGPGIHACRGGLSMPYTGSRAWVCRPLTTLRTFRTLQVRGESEALRSQLDSARDQVARLQVRGAAPATRAVVAGLPRRGVLMGRNRVNRLCWQQRTLVRGACGCTPASGEGLLQCARGSLHPTGSTRTQRMPTHRCCSVLLRWTPAHTRESWRRRGSAQRRRRLPPSEPSRRWRPWRATEPGCARCAPAQDYTDLAKGWKDRSV